MGSFSTPTPVRAGKLGFSPRKAELTKATRSLAE